MDRCAVCGQADGRGADRGRRAAGAGVGDRVGHRGDALREWATVSQIVEYEPPRVFAWAVGDPEWPMATWRFSLEPRGGGTLLRQWVQLGPGPSGLSVAIEQMPDKEQKIVFVRLREFEANMGATLAAVKRLAEAS